MSSIRRLITPALTTALAALLYVATAVSASAQTYLPAGDGGSGTPPAAHTSSSTPIWQVLVIVLAAVVLAVGLTLAASRLRRTHRLSIA